MNILLWLCFAISGIGALALELLWIRSAQLVFGNTAQTVATVVAAYFAGLGAGGYLARRVPRRPVRRYGLLELAVAAGAIGSYGLFRLLSGETAQQILAHGGLGVRIAAVWVTILPVTVALGATLPTLAQALAAPGTVGFRGGALYALNTLGGACGLAAMGFGLPAVIGVRASYLAAASSNALAGLLALWIGDEPEAVTSPAAPPKTNSPRLLVAVAGGAGLLGLALEILWTVLFAQVLHNSVYSFAAVTLVFLLALAAGAALSAALLRFVPPRRVAAVSLLVAGVTSVLGIWSFAYWTDGLRYFGMNRALPEYIVRIIGLTALSAGPATVAAGAVLPALWAAAGDRQSVARPVGELTSSNLAGGVVGALVAGFVILPTLGLRAGFLAIGVGYVVLAEAIGGRDEAYPRAIAFAGLLAIVLLDPMHTPLTHLKSGETLRATSEGASGIVTVVDTGNDLQLRLDNYYVLGGSAAQANERRQGLVPLLLHSAPRNVAFIGMATGITGSAGVAMNVPDLTVIEVVPQVAEMARIHFAPLNAQLLDRQNVRLVVDDGRRYLAASTTQFDVIVSDLFIPWHAGSGSLYSREMYETVARRLAPGGLFCQWLPLYQLTREEFEVIARTFLSVFPHVTLWRNDFYPDRPVVGLIGAKEISVDLDRVGTVLRGLPEWSRDSFLVEPRALAMLYLGDLSLASGLIARGPLNMDDRPVIEFLAPRLTRMSAAGDKDWFIGAALADFTDQLADRLVGLVEPALPATEGVAEARRAGALLFRYALAVSRGDLQAAARFQDEVRRLVPDVVASADQGLSGGALHDAQRTLDTLRAEQARLRRQLESMERRLGADHRGGDR